MFERSLACSVLLLSLAACSSDPSTHGSADGGAGADGSAGGDAADHDATGDATDHDATGDAESDGASPDATAESCQDRLPAAAVVALDREVRVTNDPPAPMGIFDPSVVYPAGAPGGAMAYSAISAKDDIATRIALSSDGGQTWIYVAQANTPLALPNDLGRLISEVSSLVLDPLEPDPSRRWKLFTHRYLAKGTDLRYDIGHISLQVAAAPEGPWSLPVANVGWSGASTISSEGARFLAQDAPALTDCVAFTEPSALALPDGTLALALGCVSLTPTSSIRVVLLRSTDHALTWSYAGLLVPATDAPCLGRTPGATRANAAELFAAGGKTWLSVSPEHPALGYRGCAFVEVTELSTATLARDRHGAPAVTALLTTPSDQFAGACAYAEGAAEPRAMMSVAFVTDPRIFRIVRGEVTLTP